MSKENWEQYKVTIGGIEFRPVSMGSLALLYKIKSPIITGGDIDAVDYCIFAWIHAAPLMQVITAIKADVYYEAAIYWGAEVPNAVFASYSKPTIKSLVYQLANSYIEPKSGFVPFPLPSQQKVSWLQRVMTFITRLWNRG